MQALQKITNEVWLTSKEACDLLNTDRKGLLRKRNSGEIIARDRSSGKGGGYEYLLSSFPDEVKNQYYLDNGVVAAGAGEVQLIKKELTARQEEIALARVNLVKLFIEIEDAKESVVKKKKSLINAYNNGAFENLFKVLGKTSMGTVERWKKMWGDEKKDYRCLAPQYKTEKPSSVTPEEAAVLLKLALHPNQPLVSEVLRIAMEMFEAQQLPNIKSEYTYRRFLMNWKKKNYDQWLFFREGEKALNDKAIPSIIRDYDKIEVGDLLVGDGHVLNFEVINPFTGKPKRMMMPLFFDMKSSMPLGWEISPTENIQSIAMAFYRSLLRLGKIPKAVYLDNGKAFKAKYFQGIDFRQSGITGLFERLGIKVITAWPYHGQSKTIERFFRTFGELERMLPTYTGTSIEMQPPRMNRGEKLHRKLHEKLTDGTSFDLLSAHRAVAWWFDRYAERPQAGHLTGRAPIELFEAGRGPGIDKKELLYLMMKSDVATIYKNGIRFLGDYYWNDALYGYRDKVTIRYDLLESDAIYVYDPHGNFICTAYKRNAVHPAAHILGTTEDVKQLEDEIRNKRDLLKSTTTDARGFLMNEIYPTAQRQLVNANIIRLENEKEVLPEFIEPAKKTGTDDIAAEVLRPLKEKVVIDDEKAWWE